MVYVCVRFFESEARQIYWKFWNIKLCERFLWLLSVLKATSSSSLKTSTKFYSMLSKFKFLLPLPQAKYQGNRSASFSSTFLVRPAKETTRIGVTNIDASSKMCKKWVPTKGSFLYQSKLFSWEWSALSLVLKQRHRGTRNWPIGLGCVPNIGCIMVSRITIRNHLCS